MVQLRSPGEVFPREILHAAEEAIGRNGGHVQQALDDLSFPPCYLLSNGRKVDAIADGPFVVLDVVPRLFGGKGGFGSMLRALGAQIEKTTNKEACRDLSGRRLRDINDEERLRNYVNNLAEKEQEKAEKKKAKIEKLEKLVNNGGKFTITDPKVVEETTKAAENVHEAMEAALKAKKERNLDVEAGEGGSGVKPLKRKSEAAGAEGSGKKPAVPAKKSALWIDEFNESDLESSSDEDDDKTSGSN